MTRLTETLPPDETWNYPATKPAIGADGYRALPDVRVTPEQEAAALRYCRRMDAMDCAEALGLVKS